ncbi:MAG: hypothetical protein ABW178_04205 [Pseudoxanthomonas sp.]
MRLLTSMLYCLLALFGCNDGTSTTTVTRSQRDGEDTLFSRTTLDRGLATYQCVRSVTGRCHYQLFEETCTGAADGANTTQCARTPMDQFSLAVGEAREVKGLAGAVKDCVQSDVPGPETRCSP